MQLADILTEEEAVSAEELERAIRLQRDKGGLLAEWLVRGGLIAEDDLFFLMSRRLGVPTIPEERLLHINLSPELRQRVPKSLARQCVLVPIDLDRAQGAISVAMFDPSDAVVLATLRSSARVAKVRAYLARRHALLSAIDALYGDTDEALLEAADPPELLEGEAQGPFPASDTQVAVIPGKVELDPGLAKEIAQLPASQIAPEVARDDPSDLLATRIKMVLPRRKIADGPMPAFPTAAEPSSREAPVRLEPMKGRSLLRGDTDDDQKPWPRLPAEDTSEVELDDLELETPSPRLIEDDTARRRAPVAASEALPTTTIAAPDGRQNTSVSRVEASTDETPLSISSMLSELFASVGVLVSMLEERIDPGSALCREYARLTRLVARELGMDEIARTRVAAAAHLYGLDRALRREVGGKATPDVAAVFAPSPRAPGGLNPTLRTLGARALGIAGGGERAEGLALIRLVVDYLDLQAEADDDAGVETVVQLLRAGGADPELLEALIDAVQEDETEMRTERSKIND